MLAHNEGLIFCVIYFMMQGINKINAISMGNGDFIHYFNLFNFIRFCSNSTINLRANGWINAGIVVYLIDYFYHLRQAKDKRFL